MPISSILGALLTAAAIVSILLFSTQFVAIAIGAMVRAGRRDAMVVPHPLSKRDGSWSARSMKKKLLTPLIILLTICSVAVLPTAVPAADAQTNATPSSCFGSYRARCFVDSDVPERNGPSRYWDWVERNGWITGSLPMSRDNNLNWARWEFDPARSGSHRLICYISEDWGLADARYRVYVDGDLKSVEVVDQSLFADEWVIIDSFYVPSGRTEVELRVGDRSPGPSGLDIFVGRCRLYLGGD